MKLLSEFFLNLTLVGKELIELAARPATYTSRVVYGAILYTTVLLLYYGSSVFEGSTASMSLESLGTGRKLLTLTLIGQILAQVMVVPAQMAGLISSEKERGTLSLLILTGLSPSRIVVEKFLSGLIPGLSFFIMGLPLFILSYTAGGVTIGNIFGVAWLQLMSLIDLAAIVILCSTVFSSAQATHIGVYLVLVSSLLPLLAIKACIILPLIPILFVIGCILLKKYPDNQQEISLIFFIPYAFIIFLIPSVMGAAISFADHTNSAFVWLAILVTSIPTAAFCWLLLWLAQYNVSRHALPTRDLIPQVLESLRSIFTLPSHAKAAKEIKPASSLPYDLAIYWRETQKKYMHRLPSIYFTVGLVGLYNFYMIFVGAEYSGHLVALTSVIIIGLLLLVLGAFGAERFKETIDLWLVTPNGAQQYLAQHERVLIRWWAVMIIPLWLAGMIQTWPAFSINDAIVYFLLGLLLPPLFTWGFIAINLLSRKPTRSFMISVLVLGIIHLIPILVNEYAHNTRFLWANPLSEVLNYSVPLHLLYRVSGHPLMSHSTIFLALLSYAALIFGVRSLCYRNAEFLMTNRRSLF